MTPNKKISIPLRSMAEREYLAIPVNRINILNHRERDRQQFREHIRSIDEVGLYKPIFVNKRHLDETGMYDLICGEGRLSAFIDLGRKEILAEVVDVDDESAYIYSLVENIARVQPSSIEFARALIRMADEGVSIPEIARITGRSESNVADYIRLMKNGEERLIRGVEENIFPISFAVKVAGSEKNEQRLLMDAYEDGTINSNNMRQVREIIEGRKADGKGKPPENLDELKSDIKIITEEKEGFCTQAERKENRLMQLLVMLKKLREDAEFRDLLKENGIPSRPELKDSYEV